MLQYALVAEVLGQCHDKSRHFGLEKNLEKSVYGFGGQGTLYKQLSGSSVSMLVRQGIQHMQDGCANAINSYWPAI